MNRGAENVMPLRAVITLLLFPSNLPEYLELSEAQPNHTNQKYQEEEKGKDIHRHTCTHTHTPLKPLLFFIVFFSKVATIISTDKVKAREESYTRIFHFTLAS